MAAAMLSRSGVSGVTLSGGGVEAMAQQHMSVLLLHRVVEQQMVMTAKVELATSDLG
jgi:hypothetical protein